MASFISWIVQLVQVIVHIWNVDFNQHWKAIKKNISKISGVDLWIFGIDDHETNEKIINSYINPLICINLYSRILPGISCDTLNAYLLCISTFSTHFRRCRNKIKTLSRSIHISDQTINLLINQIPAYNCKLENSIEFLLIPSSCVVWKKGYWASTCELIINNLEKAACNLDGKQRTWPPFILNATSEERKPSW